MTKYTVEVVEITENDDDTVNVAVEMSFDALRAFAAKGLYQSLIKSMEETVKELDGGYSNPEGAGDGPTGAVGSSTIYGEVPGLWGSRDPER